MTAPDSTPDSRTTVTAGQAALADAWEAQAAHCAAEAAKYGQDDGPTREQARIFTARETTLADCASQLRAAIAAAAPAPAGDGGAAFDAIIAEDGMEFIRADLHDGLLDAVLKNADEDLNGFDGTREQEAEHYVRWLESERERLINLAEQPQAAPDLTARLAAVTALLDASHKRDWDSGLAGERRRVTAEREGLGMEALE